jgi:hypothetical protein
MEREEREEGQGAGRRRSRRRRLYFVFHPDTRFNGWLHICLQSFQIVPIFVQIFSNCYLALKWFQEIHFFLKIIEKISHINHEYTNTRIENDFFTRIHLIENDFFTRIHLIENDFLKPI